jgi:hypothetical protein
MLTMAQCALLHLSVNGFYTAASGVLGLLKPFSHPAKGNDKNENIFSPKAQGNFWEKCGEA